MILLKKIAPYPSSSLLLHHHYRPFSSSTTLSTSELTTISTLITTLCTTNNHPTAIRLLSTTLLTSPPLSSLPIPFLAHHLSSLPSLSPSFSLLTTLRHHNPSHLPTFSSLLLSSFLEHRRLDAATQVFHWLCKEDSPCRPMKEVYRVYVEGLCEGGGKAVEVVKAVREMVKGGGGGDIGEEVRGMVWRSLVREARVDEAMELDRVLGEGVGVGEVVERLIRDWEE